MSKKATTISLSEETFNKAQEEANKLGLPFSGFISLLLSQYFDGIRFERNRELVSEAESE